MKKTGQVIAINRLTSNSTSKSVAEDSNAIQEAKDELEEDPLPDTQIESKLVRKN